MEDRDREELAALLEGILFVAGEPVGVERLCLGLETDRKTLDQVAQTLMDQYGYHRRGIRLVRMDASYQLCSAPEYAEQIRHTLESRRPARLTQAALEVLAIAAYYQPVTKVYIDQVRGVDSAHTIAQLLDRELLEEHGRLSVPGRPILYRTTPLFLRVFGMETLKELPELPPMTQEGRQAIQALEESLLGRQREGKGESVPTEEVL